MTREYFGDGVFENHMQVTVEQKPLQPADGIQHLGATQTADDADITKLVHGTPAGSGSREVRLWAKAAGSGKLAALPATAAPGFGAMLEP
ncbi:hypothetical protein D3C84_257460 [compost metagenome]